MRLTKTILACCVSITSIASVGGVTTATAQAAPPQGASASPAITWEECPEQVTQERARCGRVEVPTYYNAPERGTISVGFVHVPASNSQARRGALFTNPGGPGGDAYSYAAGDVMAWPAGITEEWDMIGVQPRGLPGSTPVKCDMDGDLVRSYTRAGESVQTMCEKNTPGYTASLTTENTARDWDMVRRALGEESISILGLSYGTFLGSMYATLHPQHTDKVVLDSAMSPTQMWGGILDAQRGGYNMAMTDFFTFMANNDDRFHQGRTPLAVYESWSRKVQRESGVRPTALPPHAQIGDLPPGLNLPVQAAQAGADALTASGRARVEAEHLRDKAMTGGNQAMSPTLGLTRMMVPMPDKWEELAQHVAGQKDLSGVATLSDLSPEQKDAAAEEFMNAQYMQNLILCNENQTAPNYLQLPEYLWSAFITSDPNTAFPTMYNSGAGCNGRTPVTKAPALSGAALRTRPLQINATRDPQTTYALSKDMAGNMGAHLITVHGPGHGQVGIHNAAVDNAVVEYLRTGQTALTDAPGRL